MFFKWYACLECIEACILMELQTIRDDTNKVFVINQPMNLRTYTYTKIALCYMLFYIN